MKTLLHISLLSASILCSLAIQATQKYNIHPRPEVLALSLYHTANLLKEITPTIIFPESIDNLKNALHNDQDISNDLLSDVVYKLIEIIEEIQQQSNSINTVELDELMLQLIECQKELNKDTDNQTRLNGFKYHPYLLANIINVQNALYSSGRVQITVPKNQNALQVTGNSAFNGDISISGKILTNNNRATDIIDDNLIVSGDLTVNGTIFGNVSGTTTNAINFTGPLLGDVTGTQTATQVVLVGGQTAAAVASGSSLANASTSANVPNTIVRRDGSGNFSAGTISAALNGNSTGFTGNLAGDVTGPQGATVVATVGGQSAAAVANASVAVAAATSANVPNTLVLRDGAGGFASGSIVVSNDSGNSITASRNINLLTDFSEADSGVIQINGVRFVSALFDATNTYVGSESGNENALFTNPTFITAIGYRAGNNLSLITTQTTLLGARAGENSTGIANTGIGFQSLQNATNGGNTATGAQSLQSVVSGGNNTANGYQALLNATGGGNTAVGNQSLLSLTGGTNNLALGNIAGNAYTGAESNNALLASTGVVGESNTIRLGNNSHKFLFTSNDIGDDPGGNLILALNVTTGEIVKATSSARYKENIKPLDPTIIQDLEKLNPVSYTKKGHSIMNYGLIAEEVAEINAHLAAYNQEGQPENVNYIYIIPMLIIAFKEQQARIAKLEQIIETLTNN